MRDWDKQLATMSKNPQISAQILMQTITDDGSTYYDHESNIVMFDIRKQIYGYETGLAIPVSYLLTKDYRAPVLSSLLSSLIAHIKDILDVVYAPNI
ncbi:hypothetical protein CPB97_000143, partial [Podila verticillata]